MYGTNASYLFTLIGLSTIFHNNALKIKGLLLFFVIVYHGFLFYSLKHEPVNLRDSIEYINSASNFSTEANFYAGPQSTERDFRLYSKRTPIYPLVLHGIYSLHLHRNFIYLLQIFIGLSSIFMAFIFMARFFKNSGLAFLLLTIFLLFTPSQFIYSQFIMADLWLQFFVMLCILSYFQFHKTQQYGWLISLLIFSTCAALTKPVFLLASFAIGLFCLLHFIKTKKYRWVILFSLIPFLSWALVCNKNKKLTGVLHYSSIGYINLLHYNTNLYLQASQGKEEAAKILEPLMIVPHSKSEFKKNYDQVNETCKQIIISNGMGYTFFHLKGMVYFFLDPGRFDLYQFFKIEEDTSKGFLNQKPRRNELIAQVKNHPFIWLYLGLIFCFNILKTIGFLGFLWQYRNHNLAIVVSCVVFYIAFLTGPLGASRFALPVGLIVMGGAAIFYSDQYERCIRKISEFKSKRVTNQN